MYFPELRDARIGVGFTVRNCFRTVATLACLQICFLLVSCVYDEYDLLEPQSAENRAGTEYEDTISRYFSDDESQCELFTISLGNIDPTLTQKQIDQSYWQRTSFNDDQLNALEGVYLSDVGLFLNDFPDHQNVGDYFVQFRIHNNTDNSLYYTFPFPQPGTMLEKNVNGEWYEVPLFGGAESLLRGHQSVRLSLAPRAASRHLPVQLSYWRPSTEGLYRLVIEVSFDSGFEHRYFLSGNIELRRLDFRTRFSEGQLDSLEGVSVTLAEYFYEEDELLCIVKNESELTFYFALFFALEEHIDGYWYEVPINHISPSGQLQGVSHAMGYHLYPGQEFEARIVLQNWYPLSTGVYRLTFVLYSDCDVPLQEREFFPVSALFEIVKQN